MGMKGEEGIGPGQLAGIEIPRRDIPRWQALGFFLMEVFPTSRVPGAEGDTTSGVQLRGPLVQRELRTVGEMHFKGGLRMCWVGSYFL